jgi:hypothetical protein
VKLEKITNAVILGGLGSLTSAQDHVVRLRVLPAGLDQKRFDDKTWR